jgi:hypothetical protein
MPQVNVIPSAVSVTIDLGAMMSTLRALVLDPEFSHRIYSLDWADILLAFSNKIRDGYANDPEFLEEPPVIPPQEAVFPVKAGLEPLAVKIVEAKPVPSFRIDVTPAPEGEANPV